jgi:hypothetical protein
MLKAHPLLDHRLMWRLGNGQRIRIWHDKWFPSSTDNRVHSPVQDLSQEATVDALLDPVSGWWNYDLIHSLFLTLRMLPRCVVWCLVPCITMISRSRQVLRAGVSQFIAHTTLKCLGGIRILESPLFLGKTRNFGRTCGVGISRQH